MSDPDFVNTPIYALQEKTPFIFRADDTRIAYDWFYFEIIDKNEKIICILSPKDSFFDPSQAISSVYLSWHKQGKLVGYSYTTYSFEDHIEFCHNLKDCLLGKKTTLEICVPDFSLKKSIHLSLDFPRQGAQVEEVFSKKNFAHAWQFLYFGNVAQAHIETKETSFPGIAFPRFHDLYLKTILQNQPCQTSVFENPMLYWDRNFGFQKIDSIQDPWYWWHACEGNRWEVGYFFPRQNTLWHRTADGFQQIPILEKQLATQKKMTPFLFSFPKKINSPLFGPLFFQKTIELAPFYYRGFSFQTPLATLEMLIPKRVFSLVNQKLMSARQFKNVSPVPFCPKGQKPFFQQTAVKNNAYSSWCKKMTKDHGKSFFAASFILDACSRKQSYLIYALCRIVDDATDGASHKNGFTGSCFSRDLILCLWDPDYKAYPSLSIDFCARLSCCLNQNISLEVARGFIDWAGRSLGEIGVSQESFLNLVDGQKMDENFLQPKCFDDFYNYCYKVAGVVGLMMSHIFKVDKNLVARKAAISLGIAMQITNILRDVKEDFERGRLYIPKYLFDKHEASQENLLSFCKNRELVYKELGLIGVKYYKESLLGLSHIPSLRARFCVKLMISIYGLILGIILKDTSAILKKRVYISKVKKIFVILKVLIGFHPLSVAHLDEKK